MHWRIYRTNKNLSRLLDHFNAHRFATIYTNFARLDWKLANQKSQMVNCTVAVAVRFASCGQDQNSFSIQIYTLWAPEDNAHGQNTYQIIQHAISFSISFSLTLTAHSSCVSPSFAHYIGVVRKAASTTKMNSKHWACKWSDRRRNIESLRTDLLGTVYTQHESYLVLPTRRWPQKTTKENP